MDRLLREIRGCTVCQAQLPLGANPVLAASAKSRIVIIGQAPGRIVHASGIPWADKSGENLRAWLGVTDSAFYDPHNFALLPMGFCFPGKGSGGDLPPRPECAPLWHDRVRSAMKDVRLTLLIGRYAQGYYLKERADGPLTGTVRRTLDFLPDYFALPHPSPRNNIWQARNPWFMREIIPALRDHVGKILRH